MSLISKLFRKSEPDEQEQAEPTPPAATAPHAAPEVGELAQPAQPGDAVPATAPDTAPAPERTNWWDEQPAPADTTPAAEAPAHAEQAAAELPAPAARAAAGTQPLNELPDDQAASVEEEPGTRPLAAGDLPSLAMIRSQRGLAFAAARDIGRVRTINQDSIFAMITTLPREGNDISIGLFIVADGMGGHHGGEVASRMAISTVAHQVLAELVVPALTDGATEALQPLIIAAVQEANRAIWEHAQVVGSDMGTTCTVALLLGRALYLGHVGDTRAYLATPTGLRLITNDHSTVGRLIQVGQLDPSEAREHPLRSQLYRTIGQQPEVLVDFSYEQIGDATHLLMGSDGLWGMLDDEVMFDVLLHHFWPQDACNELIARANLAGGDDNISAVVVTLPAPT
ncbi:MAG: serine/threonine-protein phosphatase [Kouleothrix sp.]|jgi:serine/threonine protein phosphatase PrpC|nr:serine/threonine-protein phosphatase [Kouleothrix sp.]